MKERVDEMSADDLGSKQEFEPAAIDRPPEFADEALALRFAEQHTGDLRYVAAWGKWLEWTGARWKADDTLHAFDLARAICREASAGCDQPKIASAIASAKNGSCGSISRPRRPPPRRHGRPVGPRCLVAQHPDRHR